MLALLIFLVIALVGALGTFSARFARLGRELCRFRLGKQALAKCRKEDVPAVLRALRFDSDR